MIHVALLRGVNVGGKGKVEMARLRALVESLGATDVATYINSGNVIFRDRRGGKALVPVLERAIELELGVSAPVVVRSGASMLALRDAIPADWSNDSAQKTDVFFLRPEADTPTLLGSVSHDPKLENVLHVHGALVWNIARKDAARGNAIKLVRSDLYAAMTIRNVNTVRKLCELVAARS